MVGSIQPALTGTAVRRDTCVNARIHDHWRVGCTAAQPTHQVRMAWAVSVGCSRCGNWLAFSIDGPSTAAPLRGGRQHLFAGRGVGLADNHLQRDSRSAQGVCRPRVVRFAVGHRRQDPVRQARVVRIVEQGPGGGEVTGGNAPFRSCDLAQPANEGVLGCRARLTMPPSGPSRAFCVALGWNCSANSAPLINTTDAMAKGNFASRSQASSSWTTAPAATQQINPPACAGRPGSRSRPCRCSTALPPWPQRGGGWCATHWAC